MTRIKNDKEIINKFVMILINKKLQPKKYISYINEITDYPIDLVTNVLDNISDNDSGDPETFNKIYYSIIYQNSMKQLAERNNYLFKINNLPMNILQQMIELNYINLHNYPSLLEQFKQIFDIINKDREFKNLPPLIMRSTE